MKESGLNNALIKEVKKAMLSLKEECIMNTSSLHDMIGGESGVERLSVGTYQKISESNSSLKKITEFSTQEAVKNEIKKYLAYLTDGTKLEQPSHPIN